MMEAIRYSETSVLTRATLRHIPEDSILHSQIRENVKSYIFKMVVLPETYILVILTFLMMELVLFINQSDGSHPELGETDQLSRNLVECNHISFATARNKEFNATMLNK
jgi:hypothetical protein